MYAQEFLTSLSPSEFATDEEASRFAPKLDTFLPTVLPPVPLEKTIAIAFAQLGEKEQAFAYLNKLVEERSWQIAMLNVDPQLDPLRDDSRFAELIERVRLK